MSRWFRWGWGEGTDSFRGSVDLGQVACVRIERESSGCGPEALAHVWLRSGHCVGLTDDTALRFAERWERWLETGE